jgi:hypothetical protein
VGVQELTHTLITWLGRHGFQFACARFLFRASATVGAFMLSRALNITALRSSSGILRRIAGSARAYELCRPRSKMSFEAVTGSSWRAIYHRILFLVSYGMASAQARVTISLSPIRMWPLFRNCPSTPLLCKMSFSRTYFNTGLHGSQ